MARNVKKSFLHRLLDRSSASPFPSSPSCRILARSPNFPCRSFATPSNSQRLPTVSHGNITTSPAVFYRAWTIPTRSFLSLCCSQSNWRRIVIKRNAADVQGRRYYFVDRQGYQHFRRRGPGAWMHGPDRDQARRRLAIFLVVAGGAFVVIYVTHLQIVPYTYRKHFILISPQLETKLGEENFNTLKKQLKLQILPAIHPHSIRVRKIAKDVIQSVMEGAKADDWGEVVSSSEIPDAFWKGNAVDNRSPEEFADEYFPSHESVPKDEVIDEAWVDESRKKGLQKHKTAFTQHLEGIKWEVLVVDADIVNAFCLPGGKIVVFTGLLKHFPSNEEIATVLGHEVAHVVARHSAEQLTRNLGLALVELIVLMFFYAPDLIYTVSNLLLKLPFSRRMELEADHIGLLLMAAAGYDPRVAPALYEKLWKLGGYPEVLQYLATHPSGKKRGENLKNTATMEEAVRIYREKVAGRLVHSGYLL